MEIANHLNERRSSFSCFVAGRRASCCDPSDLVPTSLERTQGQSETSLGKNLGLTRSIARVSRVSLVEWLDVVSIYHHMVLTMIPDITIPFL